MKILIADPEKVLASCYADELAEEGYLVVNCSDSAKLMDAIAAERPDLVLIDMQMVKHPGEGFRREIENRLSMVPSIIYMSDSRFKPRIWPFSPDSFVRKTRNLQALKKKVNSTLFGRPEQRKQPVRIPQEQMSFLWPNEGHSSQ
jgi:DNA-binding response OmpR family regulator